MWNMSSIGKEDAVPDGTAGEKRALLTELLRRKADQPKVYPLSFAQEFFWLLDQWSPGSSLYSIPTAFRVTGALDVDALQRAVNVIAARHETLRTTFKL